MTSCSVHGCPGVYEKREITHTVRHGGDLMVIDHVPAEVCGVCGDVLLRLEIVRGLEGLLENGSKPTRTVPVYEYTDRLAG
jgi:YgiT-type zinc finger domain-containing protein